MKTTGRLHISSPKFVAWCEIESGSRTTLRKGFTDFDEELPCGVYWLRLEAGKEREEHRVAIAPGITTRIQLNGIPSFSNVSKHHECDGYNHWMKASVGKPSDEFGRLLIACYPIDDNHVIDGKWFRINCADFDRSTKHLFDTSGCELALNSNQFGSHYAENLNPGFYYLREEFERESPVCGFPILSGWDTMVISRSNGWIDFGNSTIILKPKSNNLEGNLSLDLLTELILAQLSRQQYKEVFETFKCLNVEPDENPVACLAFLYAKVFSEEEHTQEFKQIVEKFPEELRALADWQLLARLVGVIDVDLDWDFDTPTLFSDGWFLAFIIRDKIRTRIGGDSQMEYFARTNRVSLWSSFMPSQNSVLSESTRNHILSNIGDILADTFKKKRLIADESLIPDSLQDYKIWRKIKGLAASVIEEVNNEFLKNCSNRSACFEDTVARLLDLPGQTRQEQKYLERYLDDWPVHERLECYGVFGGHEYGRAPGVIERIEEEQMVEGRVAPKVGSRVQVFCRIRDGDKTRIQKIEGTVIGVKGSRINQSFKLRRLHKGFEVFFTFPVHSPLIESIKVKSVSKVRKAKLNYLRGMTIRQELSKTGEASLLVGV